MADKAASFTDDIQNIDDKSGASGQTGSGEGAPVTQNTQVGDQAFLIVGERAFRTKEDVVTNFNHSQTHIQKIEGENADMRKTITEQSEEIERLKLALEGQEGISGTHQEKGSSTAPLSKEELVQAVMGTLKKEQNETVRTSNINTVFSEASQAYGESMKTEVANKAKELNMSLAAVDEMAKSQPQAFRQLFLPQGGGTTSAVTDSGINTEALNKQNQNKQPGQSWSAKGKKSSEVAAEVQRRLSALSK